MNAMNWTDDRVEKLKKLWADGLSASQIAAQLGGVSRNAVIGKVHRLCLPGRAKSGGSGSAPRAKRATSAPRAPNYASRAAVRTVTRSAGATALKQDISVEAVEEIDCPAHRGRRGADLAEPGADGTDRAHLQMADRRSPAGRFPFLRQRFRRELSLLQVPRPAGLPAFGRAPARQVTDLDRARRPARRRSSLPMLSRGFAGAGKRGRFSPVGVPRFPAFAGFSGRTGGENASRFVPALSARAILRLPLPLGSIRETSGCR